MKNKFRFGADYYPEQWDESRWEQDAALMQAAGFNVVRLAEFAWAKMEPSENQFDFDWLDRAIGILASHGIDVVLGTPTASPPPWVMAQDPNLFLTNPDGARRTYGVRREYCPSHLLYRQHSQRSVRAMAQHFKNNPAVIGWQIDNELGDRCYCETCRAEFQKWLEKKYQTLDNLNEKWGTIFWSHTYSPWSQIPAPLSIAMPNAPVHNPGLALDYRRFMSDVSGWPRSIRAKAEKLPSNRLRTRLVTFVGKVPWGTSAGSSCMAVTKDASDFATKVSHFERCVLSQNAAAL